MKTLRNITLMAALIFAGSTFAQGSSSKGKDPVKEEAMQQTNDLDAIVNLTEEQRSKVFEVYVATKRQKETLEKELAEGSVDQEYIDKSIQRQTQSEFLKILSIEQYNAYKISLK